MYHKFQMSQHNVIVLVIQSVIYLIILWYKSCQVAAISGDARRALEICRRAAEITDYHLKKQLSLTSNTGMNGINFIQSSLVLQDIFEANVVPMNNQKPNLRYQIFCCFQVVSPLLPCNYMARHNFFCLMCFGQYQVLAIMSQILVLSI